MQTERSVSIYINTRKAYYGPENSLHIEFTMNEYKSYALVNLLLK